MKYELLRKPVGSAAKEECVLVSHYSYHRWLVVVLPWPFCSFILIIPGEYLERAENLLE